ncbi:adenylate/guanylate cyclase domain-containing protein [Methylobacterium fujisawaense]|uniref:adenylate/guanylate cyclase domain-containing protein n=1 Tax=Methylobacterium fujisawaense TaxID=107400 RepID=UPI0031F4B9E5
MVTKTTGIRAFLHRCCSDPSALIASFEAVHRLETLHADQTLCSANEEADCIWIVEDGQLKVLAGDSVVWRGPGEIVGEMAFLRGRPGEAPLRGNKVVAACRTRVWRVDRATLDGLEPGIRALWYETVARVLVAKLDEASEMRATQARDLAEGDRIIGRLVCAEGVQATSAILFNGAERIRPVKTKAVIWFSDLSGFSAHSEGKDPAEVGEFLRSLTDPQVEEILRAKGQVDKHMGDAVMAFWLCNDDDRLNKGLAQATRAALEAARRVSEVADASGLPIGIRIGLHAGEVSVGDFGGGDRIAFTLVGQPVNEAARYEQWRPETGQPTGRVRVSDRVYAGLPEDVRSSFQPTAVRFADKHGRPFVAFLSSI